jgi:hypothetical protein
VTLYVHADWFKESISFRNSRRASIVSELAVVELLNLFCGLGRKWLSLKCDWMGVVTALRSKMCTGTNAPMVYAASY